MTTITLGGYAVESCLAIIQHEYWGGEGGYKQVLEVAHPDGSTKFIMHERGEDRGGAIHRFSEWQTLQDAKNAIGVWPDANLKRLEVRPGFVRFVDLQWDHDVPWFYAQNTEQIDGDKLKKAAPPPLLCDGCNVRGSFEHRCHGTRPSSRIQVRGERVDQPCECPECKVFEN